jgi:hypothetical protein
MCFTDAKGVCCFLGLVRTRVGIGDLLSI